MERFNPVLSALEARLTHPRFIEAHRLSPFPNRSTDIGVVLDLMIHDLEIILHLVRSPVQTIDAVGVPVLSRREDIANARIRFENGCVANITSSRISPERMRKIRVFQEDAYLSLDYQNQTGEIYRKVGGGIERAEVEIEKEEPLKRQILVLHRMRPHRSAAESFRLRSDRRARARGRDHEANPGARRKLSWIIRSAFTSWPAKRAATTTAPR